MKPTLAARKPIALPRRPRAPLKPPEYRSPHYWKWVEYYELTYHNKPDSDLSARQLADKHQLRQWMNEQSTLRPRPGTRADDRGLPYVQRPSADMHRNGRR